MAAMLPFEDREGEVMASNFKAKSKLVYKKVSS